MKINKFFNDYYMFISLFSLLFLSVILYYCFQVCGFNLFSFIMFGFYPAFHLFWFFSTIYYIEETNNRKSYEEKYKVHQKFYELLSLNDKSILWVVSLIFGGVLSYIAISLAISLFYIIDLIIKTKIGDLKKNG